MAVRLQTYWEKEKNGEYQLLAVLPEKQVSKIEGLYYGVMGVGYFDNSYWRALCVFYPEKTIYRMVFIASITGWKSFTQNMVYGRNTVLKRGYDTVDAIIAYGNENQIYFVNEFSCIHLTKEEVEEKEIKAIAMVWLTINSGYGWDCT